MGHYSVSKRVRRRKVADIATKSRMYSVNNCTIQNIDGNTETETIDGITYIVGKRLKWKKEHHKQPKPLYHSHFVTVKGERKKVKSQFPDVCSTKLTRKELIQLYIKEKLKKWERKNPCPAKDNDLFKEEFIPQWESKKKTMLERITERVNARYDKNNDIRLNAKYEDTDGYTKELARMKTDEVTDNTSVNHLDPEKSELLKKAKKLTNAEKKNNKKLVATNLLDVKRKKGRIILPDSELKNAA